MYNDSHAFQMKGHIVLVKDCFFLENLLSRNKILNFVGTYEHYHPTETDHKFTANVFVLWLKLQINLSCFMFI